MEPRKAAIMAALDKFVAQRPGLEFGNYGNIRAYRSEMRSITRDRHDYNHIAWYVRLNDEITVDMLVKAAESAFSGRLRIRMEWGWQLVTTDSYGKPEGIVCGFETEAEALARLEEWRVNNPALADHTHVQPARNRACIDYVTGQYFPTEYRKAAAAVLAAALWAHVREQCMPAPDAGTLTALRPSPLYAGKCTGDWLSAYFRKEFGRSIANRWFS